MPAKKNKVTAAKKMAAPKKPAARKPAVKKPAVKKPKAVKIPVEGKTPAAVKPAPAKPALSRHEIQRRIRVAAYYKYLKRGGQHGSHAQDWKEAEKDILSQL